MAETIDNQAKELARRISAQVDRDGFFDHAAIYVISKSALLAVAREQREKAFDEAIDVVMEIRTDAPNWKEQAVESLTAIRNSGETSNEQ
jgi:molybdopterin synthase catalytic subunit